jgi:hypothetical protein
MKDKLYLFRSLMLTFMNEKHLETDPIMKMLCDDIYIAYKTIGTSIGAMFTCARQNSQGRQQTYACSAMNAFNNEDRNEYPSSPRILKMPKLTRQSNNVNLIEELELDVDVYNNNNDVGLLSHNILSPYSSDGVVSLMRDVSGNQDIMMNTKDL